MAAVAVEELKVVFEKYEKNEWLLRLGYDLTVGSDHQLAWNLVQAYSVDSIHMTFRPLQLTL
jgi:hypothetical protein